MILVIYPAVGYNSFVTLPEANTLADQFMTEDAWNALSDDDKMRRLTQAFFFIEGTIETMPAGPEECLNTTQVEMALFYNDTNYGGGGSSSGGEIKKAQVGPISVEYTEGTQFTAEDNPLGIPERSYNCLDSYGIEFISSNQFRLKRS